MALAALNIGPGDEVAVPACTYMATPIAVLAAGAIPIIVDIDESITLDPVALEAANPAYETRIFGPDRVKVQGRLIGLIRSY